MNGGFVVNTNRKGSGVPFYQALEQSYNRPAKVSSGIIVFTRKKDAVALCGIIKHKKDEYVHFLKMQDDVDGELSVYHDFNSSSAKKIKELVQEVKDYRQKVCSPFLDLDTLKNVVTGELCAKWTLANRWAVKRLALMLLLNLLKIVYETKKFQYTPR